MKELLSAATILLIFFMALVLFSTSKVPSNCHFKMSSEIINVGLSGPRFFTELMIQGCCGSVEVVQLPRLCLLLVYGNQGHNAHMPPNLIQLVGVAYLKP